MDIYDPIAKALNLTPIGDISLDEIESWQISPFERKHIPINWTDDMRKECGDRQRSLISSNNHYFCGNTERNLEKLADGTHPFLDIDAQRERGRRPRKRSPKIYASESNKKRMAEGKHIQVSTVTCPHCGKEGNYMIMKRWHFDKCKNYSASPAS